MTTVTIPASTLRAALTCAAKGDVRFYLNGVYLDLPKGRIISTTGAFLFAGKIDSADCAPVILPRQVIETALKALGKKNEKCFMCAVTIESGNVRIEVPGAIAAGACIDGRFPDYERIIPRETSGEAGQYDPSLLLGARDALNAYTGHTHIGYALMHNGEKPAVMADKDCFVVVIPARLTADVGDLSWFDGIARTEAKAE
jgi:hypothetical protein